MGEFNSRDSDRIRSIPQGDIVKVSDLIDLAGLDLDKREEGKESTAREEGQGILIEVYYRNYVSHTLPNSLPPSYEYRIFKLPAETFKLTKSFPQTNGDRTIMDVRGLYIICRVGGIMGRTSLSQTVLMLLELVAALGIVHWIVNCAALNWRGPQGPLLERLVEPIWDLQEAKEIL